MAHTEDKNQRLGYWLAQYAADTGFSGSVQVISKGSVIFKKHLGFADREKGTPISDKTVYRFYSLTKPFVAIGIMKLYEEGRISLSAHPGKYLSCAQGLDPRITVEMLLKHTSGLAEIASPEALCRKKAVSFSEEIEKLASVPLAFTPGSQVEYLNTNYILLSVLLEAAHGTTIQNYLEGLFRELGMETACCDMGDRDIPNMAVGYERDGGELVPAKYVNMRLISGAGCGAGRLEDVQCLYSVIKKKRFLKSDTWDLVFTPSAAGDFGAGCIVFNWHGKRMYQHNGGFLGFRTIHRYLPDEDFDIIILSNVGFMDPRIVISEKIFEIYYGSANHAKNPEMDAGFI